MGELERNPEIANRDASLLSWGVMPEALLAVAFISPEREKAIATYIERIEETPSPEDSRLWARGTEIGKAVTWGTTAATTQRRGSE
jgi:hypothetical protein